MNSTDGIVTLIRNPCPDPYNASDAVRHGFEAYSGDADTLLSELSGIIQEMRARGTPGSTSNPVINGTIRSDMPRIIAEDLMYRTVTDICAILDPGRPDDVDLRSVAELYMEVIDILAVEFRDICLECRKYPSARNVSDAVDTIGLIGNTVRAASLHLTVHSTESPASYRRKVTKTLVRCGEHADLVLHGTGISAPDIEKALAEVSGMFAEICAGERLAEIQQERNRIYRADRERLRKYLSDSIMRMNGEMESLDLTDLTQRRYLAELITL